MLIRNRRKSFESLWQLLFLLNEETKNNQVYHSVDICHAIRWPSHAVSQSPWSEVKFLVFQLASTRFCRLLSVFSTCVAVVILTPKMISQYIHRRHRVWSHLIVASSSSNKNVSRSFLCVDSRLCDDMWGGLLSGWYLLLPVWYPLFPKN